MPESNRNAEPLGKLLARQRHQVGLSLEELAKRADLDKSTIYRIEQGRIEAPSPQKLQRLAAALGTDVEDYFALAGYFTPHGLPGLGPYLRAKYDVTGDVAREIEEYFAWIQARRRTGHEDELDDNQQRAA